MKSRPLEASPAAFVMPETSSAHRIWAVAALPALGLAAIMLTAAARGQRRQPGGWQDADIGRPAAAGSHSLRQGVLTVRGAGAGASLAAGQPDQLHFTFQRLTGDVEITARIARFSGPPHAQAGLMLRGDATPHSSMASVLFLPAASSEKPARNVVDVCTRSPGGKYPHSVRGAPTLLAPPLWVRIVRVGNDYAAYKSSDGSTWAEVQNDTGGEFAAAGPFEAGFAVSSAGASTLAQATIDHISIGPPRREYRTSWVGNSFSSDSAGYVSNGIGALYVAPDGTCYTNSYYDEAGESAKIYKDGKVVKAIDNPPSGNNLCYEGSITGDGTFLYLFTGHLAIYRTDRQGSARSALPFRFTTPLGNPKTGATISGMAAGNGELYVSDAAGHQILVASTTTLGQLPDRSFPFTRPGPIAVDRRGDLWIIQEGTDFPAPAHLEPSYPAAIKCYHKDGTFTGRQITDLVIPTALCIDPTQDRLLVCENGSDQNVRIYTDLDTAPRCTEIFGARGGVWAGRHPGLIHDPAAGGDRRFAQIFGVGVDARGNIYVSGSSGGADLRQFRPDGSLGWRLLGLHFVDCGDLDPASDGKDVYTPFKHYTMDYSRTAPGGEWTCKAYTWNPWRYGPAPRNNDSSAVIRRLGPRRSLFMFTSGQGVATPLQIYRFEGETAIPCGRIAQEQNGCQVWIDRNGDGKETPDEVTSAPRPADGGFVSFDVDARGDIWTVWASPSHPVIRQLVFQGLDPRGIPQYGVARGEYEDFPFPAPFVPAPGGAPRIKYDRAHDALYLYGAIPNQKHPFILARYDHWSAGNRVARYAIAMPTPDNDPNFTYVRPYPYNLEFGYMAFDLAGDRLFVAELWGPIHVFDANTGKPVTLLNPGPEVSGLTAWEDENMGIRACRRSNGEYEILEENSGFRARENLYRWKPPAGAGGSRQRAPHHRRSASP